MSIKEIFCQDKAISMLERAFSTGRIPHAYIFAGMEGVGKFRTAVEWGKLLLCEKPVAKNDFGDSCGKCESCRYFEAGSHPDFIHVYKELIEFTKDGKGRTTPVDLPIDVIREFLIDKVSAKPTVSARRIFVVSEGEKLNAASQNALLKVLEEPPDYCSIILICTKLDKLLPTTKSRSQILRFGPIEQKMIIDRLERMGLGKIESKYLARLSQGSLGQACQWGQLELANACLYKTKKQLVVSLAGSELKDLLDLAGQLLSESKRIAGIWSELEKNTSKTDIGRRAAKILVNMVISVLHDSMKIGLSGKENLVNFDQAEQISTLGRRFSAEKAAEKIADEYRILQMIDSSVNEKLIFEQLLLNLFCSDTIKD
ncbi:MAG: DNA polymerase III subunit [Planctomycetota bacterium]|jgi:DNA polymerase-3 subunit delta'